MTKKPMTAAEALAFYHAEREARLAAPFRPAGVTVKDRLFHAAQQAMLRGNTKPMEAYKALVAMM